MDLLLTNCSKCNKLMIRSISRTICKQCFLERAETQEPTEPTDELPAGQTNCQTCGAEMDETETFCARCRLREMNQARSEASEFTEKLDQSLKQATSDAEQASKPRVRTRDKEQSGGSRFHGRDTDRRQRGKRRGKGSYTPNTKYSS